MRSVVLGMTAAALAVAGLAAQPGRFRTGVELVHVAVMVENRRGTVISQLNETDFALFENGVRQEVRYFLRGDAEADALNLRLGLLLDTSGSMSDDMSFARTAAVRFLKALPEAQDITLVDFDTEVRVSRYGYADFPRLVERIRTRAPDGWTALWDALGIYIDGVHHLDGRKVMVVYTDGGDTRSAQTYSDVIAMLKAADVTVYAIGFLEHQPHSVRTSQKMKLQQIAETTGGQAYFPVSRKALDDVYGKIVAQVRAQYTLGFVSNNGQMDGTWRELEVRLQGNHLESLRIRARKGYYAPLRQEGATRSAGRP